MSRAYIRRAEPFTPRNISNCSLWYDGADPAGTGVPPSVGATVSTWVDKSGNSNNGTSGSATFQRDSLGGYINFTGSQYYSITNPNIVVNQYFTVFIVEQLQNYSAGPTAGLIAGTTEGSVNKNLVIYYNDSVTVNFAFWGNDIASTVSPGFTTNGAQPTRIWSNSFIANSRNLYINGVSVASDTNNSFISEWVGARIGYWKYGNYTGKIREVMIYSGTITTPQREQVESYLAQKWGLRNQLSQTHAAFINILYPVSIRPTMTPRGYFTQFSPTSIAGSVIWLDAADTSKYTLSGSNVTQMIDKSSNAYTLTGSSGSYPTQTTTLNGLPVISSAAGKYLQITSFNQNFTTATCFAIVRPTEDITPVNKLSGGYPLYVIFNGVAVGGFQFGINYANQTQQPGDDSRFTVTLNKSGTALLYGYLGGANRLTYNPVNTNLLISAVMSGSSGTNAVYSNGTSVNLYTNSGTFSSMTPTLQCLGLPGGQSFGYDFAEALVYGTTLTTSQIQQVESYLAQKWGSTASLPASHLNTTQPAGYPTPGTALKRSMVPLDIPIVATGGTTSIINGRKYHYFLSDGTFTINTTASVEIFLIGGGAGGSSGTYTCAGGGAGGLVLQTINLRSGSYAITVGQGGGSGSSGGNSVMAGVATAFGGGSGNTSGGCGGGQTVNGGGPGSGSQGFAGGPAQGGSYNGYNNFNGGGGGGVRGAGGIGGGYTIEGLPNTSSGGMGITYSDGSSYGGGGSGGSIASGTTSAANGFGGGAGAFYAGSPSAGTNGTGGGGGGGSQNSGGASGGHGIVILSYIPVPPIIGYSNVRYVRFTGGFNGDTWSDIAELRIFDSEGTNLCSGKTINQATSASGQPVVFVTGINGSVGSGTEGGNLSSPQSGSRFIDGDITTGIIANQWAPLIDLGSNSTVYSGSFWYGRYPYRSLNAQIDLLDAGSNLVKRWTVTQVDSRPMSWTFPN